MMLKVKLLGIRMLALPLALVTGLCMIPLMWLEELQDNLETRKREYNQVEYGLQLLDNRIAA